MFNEKANISIKMSLASSFWHPWSCLYLYFVCVFIFLFFCCFFFTPVICEIQKLFIQNDDCSKFVEFYSSLNEGEKTFIRKWATVASDDSFSPPNYSKAHKFREKKFLAWTNQKIKRKIFGKKCKRREKINEDNC